MRLNRCLFSLFLVGLAPALICAQTAGTGAIAGRVLDPTGAVVPTAQVVVTSEATSHTRTVTSGPDGEYKVGLLPPGLYKVKVTVSGFKTQVVNHVNVVVTETTTLNVGLALGEVREEINVVAEVTLIRTESAALGSVVSERVVSTLPLVSRNYTQIMALAPGVYAEVYNAATAGRNSLTIRVSGSRGTESNFQMNGVEVNNIAENVPGDYGAGGGIPIPNPDAIQEFHVQTALYDASYGRNSGANVNVIFKSGGNRFHGSVFEFFRNDVLNANDFFFNRAGQPKPVLKQNQFGFSLGGPIQKDKLFFFVSYQGSRARNGVSGVARTSALLPPLTNDRSRAALGAIAGGQSGFRGGVAVAPDGSNINQVALNLLNAKLPNGEFMIPNPQQILPSGLGFYTRSIPAKWTEDQLALTVDRDFGSRGKLTGNFFWSRDNQNEPFPAFAGNTEGFQGQFKYRNTNLALAYTFVPTPHMANETRFGFNKNRGSNVAEVALRNSVVGITAPNDDLMTITVSGLFAIGPRPSHDTFIITKDYSFYDTFFYTRGRHSIKAGGSYVHNLYDLDLDTSSWQSLTFYSFADFLLGMSGAQNGTAYSNVGAVLGNDGIDLRRWPVSNVAAFFQDDVRVFSRVTLNLGVRWEYFGAMWDTEGRLSNFLPEQANPDPPAAGTFAGMVVASNYPSTVPAGVVKWDNKVGYDSVPKINFGPRVGLAIQPTGSPRFVVRAGYGIYYSRTAGEGPLRPMFSLPFNTYVYQSGTAAALATFQQPFNPAIPPPSAYPLWKPITPTSDFSGYGFARDLRTPMTSHYSLNLQFELAKDLALMVGYVGSRAWRLLTLHFPNQADLASPASPIRGETTNTVANVSLRVPLRGVSRGFNIFRTDGFSDYSSLQAQLNKRFSRGLQFQASYTWSKTITNSHGDFQYGGTAYGNQHDPRAGRGVPIQARPHRLVVSYLYELPSLSRGSRFVRDLLSGWGVSGVTTLQAGSPLFITDSRGGTIYGTSGAVPAQRSTSNVQIATAGSVTDRLNGFLSPLAFGLTPVIGDGRGFGNTSPGIVRGPDQRNFDVSLFKRTALPKLGEGANVTFRAEFFNAFNTPQFSNPGTNVGSAASFGVITSTAVNPRIIQLALKLQF